MGRVTRSDWAVALVSAPVILLAAAWLGTLALASGGEHPIWYLRARNLAEAAAFRDGGAIVRMIQRGDEPNQAADVREGFISREPIAITPIEAAIEARRGEMVRLLLELGARPDAATWTTVWCEVEDGDVKTILAAYRPPGAGTECTEQQEQP